MKDIDFTRTPPFKGKAFCALAICLSLFLLFALAKNVIAEGGGFQYFPCPFQEDKSSLWGYIDKTRKVIIKPQFYDADSFNEGLAKVVVKSGKAGFIDTKGRMIIKPVFDNPGNFHDGMSKVYFRDKDGRKGHSGYIDRKGTMVIPPQFEEAQDFSEGLALVCEKHKKCGYIDKRGKYAIQPIYDSGWDFSEGLAAVCFNNKCGYINKTGKLIIEPFFDRVWPFSEGLAAVSLDGKKWGFIDKSGKMLIEPKIDGVCGKINMAFSDGLLCVEIGDNEGFINKQGELVIDTSGFYRVWDFQEGLAGVVIDEAGKRIMYIDKTGKPAFEAKVDVAGGWLGPFTKDGVAKICGSLNRTSYEACGFIDRRGKFSIEPTLNSGGY